MNKDQQTQGKTPSKSELDSIIRQGKWGSQSDANSYLQQHGLSAKIGSDGSAEIFDDQNQRVASVKFQGTDQDRQVSSINY